MYAGTDCLHIQLCDLSLNINAAILLSTFIEFGLLFKAYIK